MKSMTAAIAVGRMPSAPLARRYTTVGRAALCLNDIQIHARDAVAAKIRTGVYRQTLTACPACGSEDGILVSHVDMYGLPYGVAICAECDFVYTHRRLDDRSLLDFYNNEYRRLDRGRDVPHADFFEHQYRKGEVIQRVLDSASLQLPIGALVVEIGCGAGGIVAYFRDRGHCIAGFDVGDEYIRFGRERYGLNLQTGNLATAIGWLQREAILPALVIYEQVLEHLPDPLSELTTLRAALAPDSIVFVGVPGLRDIDRHYDSDFLRYLQFPHLVHFDLASLTRIARRAGLDLVAGNEIVQAAFRRAQTTDHPSFRSPEGSARTTVLSHLEQLERRWRSKRRRAILDEQRRRISAHIRRNEPLRSMVRSLRKRSTMAWTSIRPQMLAQIEPAVRTVRQDVMDCVRASMRPSPTALSAQQRQYLGSLRADGFVVVHEHWSRPAALAVRDELLRHVDHATDRDFSNGAYLRCWDERDTDQGVRRIYHVERLMKRLLPFRHDPLVMAIAAAYYGFAVYSGALVYQHNLQSNHNTRWYHVDMFDKEFKAFLYLDDVTDANGPFTYLRGSHKAHFTRLKRQIARRDGMKSTSFDTRDVAHLLDREVRICAPAGTLILADVRGLHRGSPQSEGARSVLVNYLYRQPGDVRIDA